MKKEIDFLLDVNTSWFDDLTFTEAIIYGIIKQECDKNNGECRLNNIELSRIIRRGDMMVSLSVTGLFKKGYINRDIKVRSKRVITLSHK